MIEIKRSVEIDERELVFRFSRSSGPGGQNVNKVNTRVTLLFDVVNTASLSNTQKKQVLERLATRASKDGVIRVVSQRHRSQNANRQATIEKLQMLLKDALTSKPKRKKTKIPKRIREKRLQEKKRRSMLKQQRAKIKPNRNYRD